MNKKFSTFTLVLLSLYSSVFACGDAAKTWTLDKGLQQPESAIFDPLTQHIFISNVAGNPKDKDRNGYISRVNSEGTMLAEKWIDQLNAPKGLGVFGNEIWIADIDEVVIADISTARAIKKIPLAGAKFANDVAIAKDGTVYVSDTETSRVYKIQNQKAEVFVEGAEWESPNGLFVDGNTLYVGGWGYLTDISQAPEKLGNFYSIDLKSKKKTVLSKKPLGNLDGVWKSAIDGTFYVSDWKAGVVMAVSRTGWVGNVNGFNALKGRKVQGTADLSAFGKLLLIPSMVESKLYAVKGGVF